MPAYWLADKQNTVEGSRKSWDLVGIQCWPALPPWGSTEALHPSLCPEPSPAQRAGWAESAQLQSCSEHAERSIFTSNPLRVLLLGDGCGCCWESGHLGECVWHVLLFMLTTLHPSIFLSQPFLLSVHTSDYSSHSRQPTRSEYKNRDANLAGTQLWRWMHSPTRTKL